MPLRILLTAWNAYPAIAPDAGGAVGGLETFAWSLARQLAKIDQTEVIFCVRETKPPRDKVVDGVQLYSVVEPLRKMRHHVSRQLQVHRRFPWIELRQVSANLLWQVPVLALSKLLVKRIPWEDQVQQVLREVAPDVVLSLGVNADSAAAGIAAAREGIPMVLWTQSNADLDRRFFTDDTFQDQYRVTAQEARASLNNASLILCQTAWQQRAAAELVQVPIRVIPNPVDSVRFHPQDSSFWTRRGVLWIGRYDQFHKRPLLALEIAGRCSDVPFRMVINAGDAEVKREFGFLRTDNVRVLDYLPNDQMPQAFREAKLFLSTGSNKFEGFPNVLLEAAASGTPICSLEDFDCFLQRSGSGEYSNDNLEELVPHVELMYTEPAVWQKYSDAGVKYVREHHSLQSVGEQFQQAVNQLLSERVAKS